jgi:molecular chaperone GrpE
MKKPKDNKVEELQKKAEEYLKGWQRAQADLSNYRKQVEKEQTEFAKFATGVVICEILPVIDNFDRALAHIPEDQKDSEWVKGIISIRSQLADIFSKLGVTKIECVGKPFNPAEHEALMSEESKDHPQDTVIAELEAGYKLHDKVIRPSKVKISKNKS